MVFPFRPPCASLALPQVSASSLAAVSFSFAVFGVDPLTFSVKAVNWRAFGWIFAGWVITVPVCPSDFLISSDADLTGCRCPCGMLMRYHAQRASFLDVSLLFELYSATMNLFSCFVAYGRKAVPRIKEDRRRLDRYRLAIICRLEEVAKRSRD
jgi:hypothetical protein